MFISLGAKIGEVPLHLVDYINATGNAYPNISKIPFIILKAGSNKIRSLVEFAKTEKIQWSAFTDTMTEGSWEEQLSRTQAKTDDELIFYGAVLFGPWSAVSELTKKFSLWK